MPRSAGVLLGASLCTLGVACSRQYEAPPGAAFDDGIPLPRGDESGSGTAGGSAAADEASGSGSSGSGGPNFLTEGFGEGSGGCGEVQATLQQVNPTIQLVVDQSLSMDDPFDGGESRWDSVYSTLFEGRDAVVDELESNVRFGMTLYTGPVDGQGDCPLLISVDPELDNATELDRVFDREDPLGQTPTGESLDLVVDDLDDLDADGPKVILLATDGEPDTCADPDQDQNDNSEAQGLSLSAIERAFDLGIQTFVISVGDNVGEDHLQELANVGVGKDADDDDAATFYQALDPEDLVDAFRSIIGAVTPCEFEIDGVINVRRACEGVVELDGDTLDCGDDWELLDGSTMALLGDACETLRDGDEHSLDATWPCEVIGPIP